MKQDCSSEFIIYLDILFFGGELSLVWYMEDNIFYTILCVQASSVVLFEIAYMDKIITSLWCIMSSTMICCSF